MLQEQIPTFKCRKNEHFENRRSTSKKSSISEVVNSNPYSNDFVEEKENIGTNYNDTQNNLFKSSFLRKKEMSMGYESYTSNFIESNSNLRQTKSFSETFDWPHFLEYQGAVFEFVNVG